MKTKSGLALPVAKQTLVDIWDNNKDIVSMALFHSELASLVIVAKAPQFVDLDCNLQTVETALSEMVKQCLGAIQSNRAALESDIAQLIKDYDLATCEKALASLGISMMSEKEVKGRAYLIDGMEWDFEYTRQLNSEKKQILYPYIGINGQRAISQEQQSIVHNALANSDDNMLVEGYAGCGKSFLIGLYVEALLEKGIGKDNIFVVTAREGQANALNTALKGVVNCESMLSVAKAHLIQIGMSGGAKNDRYAIRLAADLYLTALRKKTKLNSATFELPDVTADAKWLVREYCGSTDQSIDTTKTNGEQAEAYWIGILQAISLGKTSEILPLYYIKLADLMGAKFPEKYQYVVADEVHNFNGPMGSIAKRSSCALLAMRDTLQRQSPLVDLFNVDVREREICYSFRAGKGLADIINPIVHGGIKERKGIFLGNDGIKTNIETYVRMSIPEHPCAILVNDEWGLIEWLLRLHNAKCTVNLLENGEQVIRFLSDIIELKERSIRPKHYRLFRYREWDELCEDMKGYGPFEQVAAALSRGLKLRDLQAAISGVSDDGVYTLSTTNNVRNMEMDRVYLSADVMESNWLERGRYSRYHLNVIYLATTRTRYKLYVHQSFMNWLEIAKSRIK